MIERPYHQPNLTFVNNLGHLTRLWILGPNEYMAQLQPIIHGSDLPTIGRVQGYCLVYQALSFYSPSTAITEFDACRFSDTTQVLRTLEDMSAFWLDFPNLIKKVYPSHWQWEAEFTAGRLPAGRLFALRDYLIKSHLSFSQAIHLIQACLPKIMRADKDETVESIGQWMIAQRNRQD